MTGHLLIMHHEGRIKLCNTMVWFSNEDKLLNCLLFKKHSGTQKKEGVIQTVNPLIQRKNMIQGKHWSLKYKAFQTGVKSFYL